MSSITEIKQSIITTSKNLFYEQGFSQTTYRQIASILNISPGSISYHFKSKTDIGNIVYIDYMKSEYKKPVTKFLISKFGNYDPRLASAIEMRLQYHVYKEDRKVFNFYNELFNSQSFLTSNASMAHLTLLNDDMIESNVNEMDSVAAKGASVALTTAYFEGKLNVTFDQAMNYKIETVLCLTGLDKKTAVHYIELSKQLIEEMDITVQPYFSLDIK